MVMAASVILLKSDETEEEYRNCFKVIQTDKVYAYARHAKIDAKGRPLSSYYLV